MVWRLAVLGVLVLVASARAQTDLQERWWLSATAIADSELFELENEVGGPQPKALQEAVRSKDLSAIRVQADAAVAASPNVPVYRYAQLIVAIRQCHVASLSPCPGLGPLLDDYLRVSAAPDPTLPAAALELHASARAEVDEVVKLIVLELLVDNADYYIARKDGASAEREAKGAVAIVPDAYKAQIALVNAEVLLKAVPAARAAAVRARAVASTDDDRAFADKMIASFDRIAAMEASGEAGGEGGGGGGRAAPYKFELPWIPPLFAWSPVDQPKVVRQIHDDVTARGGKPGGTLSLTFGILAAGARYGIEASFRFLRDRGTEPGAPGETRAYRYHAYGLAIGCSFPIYKASRRVAVEIPVTFAPAWQTATFRGYDASGLGWPLVAGVRVRAGVGPVTVIGEATYSVDPGPYLHGGLGIGGAGGDRVMLTDGSLDGGMGGPALRVGVVLGAY